MVPIQKISNGVVNNIKNSNLGKVSKPIQSGAKKALHQWGLPTAATAGAFGVLLNTQVKNAQHVQEVRGVEYDPKTKNLNFTVPSKNATHINLYLFDKPVDGKVIKVVEMKKQGDNWTYTLDKKTQDNLKMDLENKEPVYYGYRAWGPNWEYDRKWTPGSALGFKSHVDANGNRFNPNKLLFDPYAKEISHDPVSPAVQGRYVDDAIYATGTDNYLRDSAAVAPKGVFVLQDKISTGEKPKRALKDDIVYEVHMRGFSKLDEKIPEEYRGTYKGAAMKAKYLKDMGITAVEFLPVQEFDDDRNDTLEKGGNYWGYQTINFFAPNKRYAYDKTPGGAIKEFKEMVKAFHDEGIKVCMDVVYNHTGEGGTWGSPDVASLMSMRGLDNSSYYETTANGRYFWDNSGCGANMNSASQLGSDLIVDSLKYWSEEMGVDAFRFDLAPVLINDKEKDGYNFNPMNSAVVNKMNSKLDIRTDDANKGSVDLIAEPWACGDGTYQVGRFPQNWKEWNDGFRTVMRSMFNKEENTPLSDVARAIAGSNDKFQGNSTRSVNFVTCHDGFTLKDVFSFNQPNNNNPEFQSDGGSDNNISWDNFGDFGRQMKAMKNAFLTMFVSKGTPMITGGDEVMRTQYGNNNAYCLDNEKNYINWNLNDAQKEMQDFVRKAANFRNAHPALRNINFFDGQVHGKNGLKDVTWFMGNALEADGNYLDNPKNSYLGVRFEGTSQGDSATSIYTGINKSDWEYDITLPPNVDGKKWYLVADTADKAFLKDGFANVGEEIPMNGNVYHVKSRSTLLFIEK